MGFHFKVSKYLWSQGVSFQNGSLFCTVFEEIYDAPSGTDEEVPPPLAAAFFLRVLSHTNALASDFKPLTSARSRTALKTGSV